MGERGGEGLFSTHTVDCVSETDDEFVSNGGEVSSMELLEEGVSLFLLLRDTSLSGLLSRALSLLL